MILLGQRLAEIWLERMKTRGKPVHISDPKLRYNYLTYVSLALWLFAIAFVIFSGPDRRENSLHGAIGQWLFVLLAMFGWLPPLVFMTRRQRVSDVTQGVMSLFLPEGEVTERSKNRQPDPQILNNHSNRDAP